MVNSEGKFNPEESFPPDWVTELRMAGFNHLADLYSYVWSRLQDLTLDEQNTLGQALMDGNEGLIEQIEEAVSTEKEEVKDVLLTKNKLLALKVTLENLKF